MILLRTSWERTKAFVWKTSLNISTQDVSILIFTYPFIGGLSFHRVFCHGRAFSSQLLVLLNLGLNQFGILEYSSGSKGGGDGLDLPKLMLLNYYMYHVFASNKTSLIVLPLEKKPYPLHHAQTNSPIIIIMLIRMQGDATVVFR